MELKTRAVGPSRTCWGPLGHLRQELGPSGPCEDGTGAVGPNAGEFTIRFIFNAVLSVVIPTLEVVIAHGPETL